MFMSEHSLSGLPRFHELKSTIVELKANVPLSQGCCASLLCCTCILEGVEGLKLQNHCP